MAGLGGNVGSNLYLRAQMVGSQMIAGQAITPWFFTDTTTGTGYGFGGDRSFPGAVLEFIEGQPSTLTFDNFSMQDHTVHLHGLDTDMANDGVPMTSFAVGGMQSFTYQFLAPRAGTYMYHCHVDTVLHLVRGMHGTVIVRPPDASTSVAWVGGPSFDEEVLWHLSSYQLDFANLNSPGPTTVRMKPDAFLLNGLETPAARNDVCSRIVFGSGQTAYLRVTNTSFQWARVRLGGHAFQVVASDGYPMAQSYTTNEIELGPGERYDLLLQGFPVGDFPGRIDYLNGTGGVIGTVKTRIVVT
jgi:FtsP/CotA-like multicopper oxidase with cupredoxin domain